MTNVKGILKTMNLPKFAFYPKFLQYGTTTVFVRKCSCHKRSVLMNSKYLSSIDERGLNIKSAKRYFNNTSTNLSIIGRILFDKSKNTNSINNTSTIDEFQAKEEEKERKYNEENETNSSSTNNDTENEEFEKLRISVLEASLPFVKTYGWTRKAIVHGVESLNYPGISHGIISDGGTELIHYFYNKCNEKLLDKLKTETKNGQNMPDNPVEFVKMAVKERLEMIEPYLDNWKQALAIMSLPQNVPKSLAHLLILVDDICYYSGDKSVDIGWYTRRIGLATIYKMTELYMLQDSSENHQDTWIFLQNRMEEVTAIESILSGSDGITKNVQQKLISAFETARNILGINYSRR